ncbi:MAG: patatin-like phospholipase family protein [Candidatus Thiodiazotropha sp. (ex Dulcina madagascariensis)]|nr:patatin-like phospholipase family protein [Candidatus Thiodiazotropha sp. (ex Dulcina madagascariensis)]MCU7928173.1 patatin-like phospholipase family protein [Candidatus Thiodiazotropha sp. (ex Dulcina madagascariensis)]
MAIYIDGELKRVGLALSGGGFRAAAFHLGVFRKLRQLGILWQVDLLSCVSGGSIAGAFLAANWGDDNALDRLHNYLASKSVAVSSALMGALNPFSTRLDELAKTYDRDLFDGATLGALAGGPRVYLNATNMSTGNMFFFVSGGGLPSEIGEHEMGTTEAPDFPLAKAVAASSAFPPVFPPLRIDQDIFPSDAVDFVTLTDGGVYDNLGVNPLLRLERNALDFAIVSDAGKPFEIEEEPTESGAVVLKSSINILMEQVRGLQFKRLELSWRAEEGPKPLWFSIDSAFGEQNPGDAVFASNVRTHLKKLKREELAILDRHAQGLLTHRIDTYAPEVLRAGQGNA